MLSQDDINKLLEEEGDTGTAGAEGAGQPAADQPKAEPAAAAPAEEKGTEGAPEGGEAGADWADAFAEAAAGGDAAAAEALAEGRTAEEPAAAPPRFDDFGRGGPAAADTGDGPDLQFILDLPLEISVELGRSRMPIRDLLQLSRGSVVELDKMAGEPAEIYVNRKLLAKGEVVVVNEKFGIRLTEIISPADRVRSLG
ncbi:flagellar motor switch protein FliN [Dissulfurirhabdus thermomarina]|uniref:Flagellar motor switch protein FliN n=1 Tax=Dissulfurirhabdus thermomarina TaxID=1765737 RepID=A0A6N9TSI8_DISTH|nr:flagellar motor switch protein FliN [Dissulfurirhabdus thermomarina]NDY42714.1 flagellar motor switch protein FliN [Dissulfurirhabdus thermomarina]NMX24467.1 flagellar motor switch protein FliN [Dissulfurirhabdus thermomarina]